MTAKQMGALVGMLMTTKEEEKKLEEEKKTELKE